MYVTLLVLSVVIYIGAVAVYLRHPAASIFHPATFYLAFHGLVFVVRPIFAWYFGFTNLYVAMGFSPTMGEKSRVLICTNLGLIAFMAVVLWVAREPIRFRQDAGYLEQRGPLLNRFWFVAVPLGFYAAYSLIWFWQFRQSGQTLTVRDQYTGAGALQEGLSAYFVLAGAILAPISAVIAYLGGFRLWSLMPFVGFAILRLGSGARGDFITGLVMIGLLFLFSRQRKWPSLLWVIPALVAIQAFNMVQLDRGAGIRQSFGMNIDDDKYYYREVTVTKPLETMDIASMEFMEYLVGVVPERTGTYDYFVSNLQLFVAPIPRILWKDKPVGAPIKMFELYRYAKPVGATYSVPGMGWYHLGYIGVVIWGSVFGLIYGLAYRLLGKKRNSHIAVIAYCVFIATAIVGFRDGTLMSVLSQSLFYILPVVGLALVARYSGLASADALRSMWPGAGAGAGAAAPAPTTPRARRLASVAAEGTPAQPTYGAPVETEAITPRQRRLARMNAN